MYLTGFADEAAEDIEGQIRATQELGWKCIESRSINKVNIVDLPESEFDNVCAKLDKAGIRVNCFGSAIANWGCQITDPFDKTLDQIGRAIPRMKRLNCRLIRIMSYAVLKDRGPEDQMEEERFCRLREIYKRFAGEGLLPVHENCMNYGGMGWTYTLKLVENVPGLKLVFDTGNPVFTDDRTKPKPYPKQSSWEFYKKVRDHIEYVHIKDGLWDNTSGQTTYTFPSEGQGEVIRIIQDLHANGYDGGFSMEPHLAVVYHDFSAQVQNDSRYSSYIQYGRRFENILKQLKFPLNNIYL